VLGVCSISYISAIKYSKQFRTDRSLPVNYRALQTQAYNEGGPSSRSTDADFQHAMDYLEERVND